MSGPWTLAVDFGTTSTVTAMGRPNSAPEILEVDGNRKMPSMVVVDADKTVVVGIAAAGLARSMPQRTIRTPKDRLGDPVPVVVGGTPYPPVAFVSAVLKHVLDDATRFQGTPPSHSRLTYPATWNRPKRARLLEAAAKAGYPEPELVAEPIAAALTHAHVESLRVGDHVAVYDLGGGTFDTVVLLRTAEGFSVVGQPLGDPQLGGELFDEILMNFVGEQIDPALWDNLLVSEDTDWMRAAARLRAECKRAKEALSSHPVAEVSVGLPGGLVDVTITRAQLDELIMPFVDESIELLGRCMADAGKDGDSIKAIYVTGGASRMPIVEQRVRELHPNAIVSRRGDPKVAVALGALLAVPGSMDASLQKAPARTTIDEEEDPNEPVAVAQPPVVPVPTPQPPVIDVPTGPATDLNIGAAGPGTSFDPAPAHQRVAGAEPVAALPQPEQLDSDPDDASISPTIVFASLIGVLLIAGAIGAFIWPGLGNGGDPPTDTVVSDSSTTTNTADPDRPEKTTTTTTTVALSSGPISAEEFEQVRLSLEDLGFGWQIDPNELNPNRKNACNLPAPVSPELVSSAAYRTSNIPTSQLTSTVLLFADENAAMQEVDFTKSFETACARLIAEPDFNEGNDIVANVIPFDFALSVPDSASDSAELAYLLTVDSIPTFDQHVLIGEVLIGRGVGTVVLHTAGVPRPDEIAFMDRALQITADKLREVQQ